MVRLAGTGDVRRDRIASGPIKTLLETSMIKSSLLRHEFPSTNVSDEQMKIWQKQSTVKSGDMHITTFYPRMINKGN